MLLVTGGAGFIGSNLVAGLNEAGRTDIVVNDALGDEGKWRNLGKRQLADVVPPGELDRLARGPQARCRHRISAPSPTRRRRDGDLVLDTNFRLSLALLDWCTATRTPFIYASSAATYGDGREGFDDDWSPPALAAAQADESLRLQQASVRSGGGRSVRQGRKAPAAMGGPEILQRVRPERVSQGRDDEPRRQALRRGEKRQGRAPVQVAPRRHRRRRAEARLHLRRRRGRGDALAARHARRCRAYSMSEPARRAASAT